jgi:small-conductance mechanosensitive channel
MIRSPCWLLFSLLLSGLAQAGSVQIPGLPGKTATPPAGAQAVETRIALVDIPARADKDERAIQEIIRQAAHDAPAKKLASDLLDIGARVEQLNAKYQPRDMVKLPIRRLESLERYWQFMDGELDAWYADLQSAARPLSEHAALLAEQNRLWTATRDDVALSPPLSRRIDELLRQIEAANAAVSTPLGHLLELDQKASGVRRQIGAELAGVSDLIDRIDRDLTRIDSVGLLEALSARDKSQTLGAVLLEKGLDIETDFSNAFDKRSQFRRVVVAVAAILLLPVFFWLSHRARDGIADGSVPETYANALTRPLSAWLLLLAMGVLLTNLHGPMIRLQIWLLLAWAPVMRLLPGKVIGLFRPWLILSALFFALNLLSLLLTSEPLLFRLATLVNGVLMSGILTWLLYRSSSAIQTKTAWRLQAVRVLLMLGIGVLAVSIVANFIGNVSLAAMLTDATLNSSYYGLFIYAVAVVVKAFSRLAFSRSAARLRKHTQHAGGLIDVVGRLFSLTLAVLWVLGTLDLFRVLRPLADLVRAVSAFSFGVGNLSVSIGGIVLFLVSVYLSFWVARNVRSMLAEDFLPNMALPRGVANSVSTMSYYLLLMAGLSVALTAAGFQLSELAIVLGALSVGIGFGLQDVVKNFVSGLILMIERPVQPGDTVELSGTVGKVREIGMRATTLTTPDGADVVVPNGMLLAEKMINWSLSSDKRRVDIPLGVAYGNEPEAVLALLLKVAEGVPGALRNPPPTALFTGFGTSSLDFSVRAWADSFDSAVVMRSALAVAIHAALKQAGIEVPFPRRDLHIKSVEPEVFKRWQADGG